MIIYLDKITSNKVDEIEDERYENCIMLRRLTSNHFARQVANGTSLGGESRHTYTQVDAFNQNISVDDSGSIDHIWGMSPPLHYYKPLRRTP